MCPVCLATVAIIAGSATGTGGLTALVVSTFRRKPDPNFPSIKQKEDSDGHEPDDSSSAQDSFSRGVD
jgi:hypothetical protein